MNQLKQLSSIFLLSRPIKSAIIILIDFLLFAIAFWLALFIRLDTIDTINNINYWILIPISSPVAIIVFIKMGLYRSLLRYISSQALIAIIIGVLSSTISLVIASYYLKSGLPRTIPFVYTAFALILIGGYRTALRSFISLGLKKKGEPVIIYGAGVAGRQLVLALEHSHEYTPYAFVDNDSSLHGKSIQGLKVYPPATIKQLVNSKDINKILLAMPSVPYYKRQQILQELEPLMLEILLLPSMSDLVSGKKQYSDVKKVDIGDILGRDTVNPDINLMSLHINNKAVMVTGAGGSIGSELCRQIIKQKPKTLVLFELSEYVLYQIECELLELIDSKKLNTELFAVLGTVQHEHRVKEVLSSYRVQTLYHAAAYKHVPLVEKNIVEGIRNNTYGTYHTAKAAIAAKVETFVLISTDKAVRPTNIMGASKRMAELTLQALAKESHSTIFTMVRFGNVLGSSGSVVPLFRKQIANGGPVTVTHPDITRYFMTIPEATQLVIQAGAMGNGGDVFVLDMGDSVKIKELATKMIHLSGFKIKNETNPEGDIEIKYTGLRPGEKLFEELLIGDNTSLTEHKRIMSAQEKFLPYSELLPILEQLDQACFKFDHHKIRQILQSTPIGFNPDVRV